MGITMWKNKRVILAAVLIIAVLTVMLPYREVLLARTVFASHNYQSTLVLDAGHGGCSLRTQTVHNFRAER